MSQSHQESSIRDNERSSSQTTHPTMRNGHTHEGLHLHHHHASEIHRPVEEMKSSDRVPTRLILCFDGTGNHFLGNTSDTNIVKLYNKFDRSALHQMHYYQPGIGTYTADGSFNTLGFFGRIRRYVSQIIDEGFATSFDAHVIAGYRFLMRYHGPGDRIYIFGFSRGAFTARFLARMVSQVGLLSMGNEEMVPFAYKLYQDYEMCKVKEEYVKAFKSTFCRHDHAPGISHTENERGVKVHFLGIFDNVNSVGYLDVPWTRTIPVPKVTGTAEHVRHAVAIDERRVKFKPSLLAQDRVATGNVNEDIKEVWFPGNHGDVGGGWPAETPKQKAQLRTFWKKTQKVLFTKRDPDPSLNVSQDPFQLSDIPLKWMIDELDGLPGDRVLWNENREGFMKHFEQRKGDAVESTVHDVMKFGGGESWGNVLFWNFMEFVPVGKRWEYVKDTWKYVLFPLNKGGRRDIPPGAVFHHAVLERMKRDRTYQPTNQVAVDKKTLKPLNTLDRSYVQSDEVQHGTSKAKAGTSFVVHQKGKTEMDNTYRVAVGAVS